MPNKINKSRPDMQDTRKRLNTLNRLPRIAWVTVSCIAIFAFAFFFAESATAQDGAVYRFRADGGNSKISGKITASTPEGISVEGRSGPQEIPASAINKIVYTGEPSQINRARDRMESGRFDDALEELAKITEPAKSPAIQQEIDFLSASAKAEISLRGGAYTAQDAGRTMIQYLKKNPQSYHFYPGTELLGKLFMAFGRPELAEKEFAKLTQSTWPKMVLHGHFYRGEALNEIEKPDDAVAEFQAIAAIETNDDLTQTFRALATVRLAKSQALRGQTDEAIKSIEEVIKVENPDNAKLFAYAYNSLGTAELKAGNLKAAATAFLHTELLYAGEAEPHAEALYQLALIWPQLDETDRASRARETLKSRYRNSYWATKL